MSRIAFPYLLLCIVLLVGLKPPIAHADAFSDGVNAYQAKNYALASKLLENAAKQGKPTPKLIFYLGMAYTHLNQYEPARQAFDMVLQMLPPDDELAGKARANINYLTKQQISLASNSTKASAVMTASLSRNSKENYLTYVIPSGKIVHFSTNRMPLKVFISDGNKVPGWKTDMMQAVNYAMHTWQGATHGKVSFIQTYTESNADIIVKWHKNFSDGILGVSPLETVGDTIVRSDVNLAVYYPDSSMPIPMEDLKAVAVHEMGHAIGIRGHSPYPDDIMFYSKTRSQNTLSQRDINTIGMLYQLDADVQNNTTMSTAQTKQYYDLYQKGLKAQTDNRPEEAIALYRQALQINASQPEAKFNLGALLINQGNEKVHQNNLSGAKRDFAEATRLYSEILQLPHAPSGSQENFMIAKTNLSIVNGALQKP
jgi:tetratricopeptide (TPR) repeat protein